MIRWLMILAIGSQVALAASSHEGVKLVRQTPLKTKGTLNYGDKAYTGAAMPVTILNPTPEDGRVLVQTVLGMNIRMRRSYLATTNGCIRNICVGDRVVTGRLANATVLAHFEDGTFITNDNVEVMRWDYKDLALREGCTQSFCRGDHVLNSKGNKAFVEGFFGNGDYLIRNADNAKFSIAKQNELKLTFAQCRNIPIERKGVCHK